MFSRVALCAGLLVLGVAASAQEGVLTLSEALSMAKERNGNIRAAEFQVLASNAAVRQSRAAFMPTITPSYTYVSNRREVVTTSGNSFFQDEGGSSLISAKWRLLDTGERLLSLRSSKSSLESQKFSARQTLRTTLFTVTQDYYETLRAQALLKVAQSQVDRSKALLDQIQARIAVEDAAKIERLQADADFQNARVQALVAQNNVTTNSALLKADIGLDSSQPLPALQPEGEIANLPAPATLPALLDEGLKNRPDLSAQRQSLRALDFGTQLSKRQAGVTAGLDAGWDQELTPKSLQNRTLTFSVSFPLFDGGRLREAARESEDNLNAQKALLVQAERNVRAEIESANYTYTQNAERLTASQSALDAARQNFEATNAAYQAQVNDFVSVQLAQTSLTLAESNYIQAEYDYRIAEARLRLATGRPVQGE
ncbi:TolC family protein [soil metagenome]